MKNEILPILIDSKLNWWKKDLVVHVELIVMIWLYLLNESGINSIFFLFLELKQSEHFPEQKQPNGSCWVLLHEFSNECLLNLL